MVPHDAFVDVLYCYTPAVRERENTRLGKNKKKEKVEKINWSL